MQTMTRRSLSGLRGLIDMIKWLYDHYVLTGAISLYYMVLLGYGTLQMFGDVSVITAPAASAYLGLLGLPPSAIGLIKWRLGKDNGISDE